MLVQAHGIVDGLPRDLAKDGVLAIEVVTAIHCDEELAVVGVWGILIGTCEETPAWYDCLVRLAPGKGQDRLPFWQLEQGLALSADPSTHDESLLS